MNDLSLQITTWLQARLENSDVYIVDIQYFPKRDKIQIFLDSDSHLSIDTCVEISRYLETLLEENKYVGENYILEVSSPGVGTPFKVHRQYQKAIGKTLEIVLQDNTIQEGVLQAIDELALEIAPTPEKSNKKNKLIPPAIKIPFAQIKNSKEKVTF